ncbi:MAG: 3-dehydroquinate synthase [Erysipelotrichaceae bacterium]|nr:3-dehydroquinate synthase [Erysipelotrichaceae bacterium]MDD3810268.1 3-dehydroquinate synthase [Erysipelotrichaceae bacterium]
MEMIVDLGKDSYPIVIEKGVLDNCLEQIGRVAKNCKIVIISDDNVYPHYGPRIEKQLQDHYQVNSIVLPHGEKTKSYDNLLPIYNQLLDLNVTRTDLIIALGGGVIGDLTGFVAASYLRGVKFVQIPTSLLAQVDSSVGGKVAVDLPKGKNLVGAFYQPSLVLIDPETLDTLDDHFIKDGMGEVIKYGCIKDATLFEMLEKAGNFAKLKENIAKVIEICVNIKRVVVENDQYDFGERILLNFGHTLAHALEAHYNFETYSHGEAVAIGMYQITRLGEKRGQCPKGTAQAIKDILISYGLPYQTGLKMDVLTPYLKFDKKNLDNGLKIVLIDEIGSSFVYKTDSEYFTESETC